VNPHFFPLLHAFIDVLFSLRRRFPPLYCASFFLLRISSRSRAFILSRNSAIQRIFPTRPTVLSYLFFLRFFPPLSRRRPALLDPFESSPILLEPRVLAHLALFFLICCNLLAGSTGAWRPLVRAPFFGPSPYQRLFPSSSANSFHSSFVFAVFIPFRRPLSFFFLRRTSFFHFFELSPARRLRFHCPNVFRFLAPMRSETPLSRSVRLQLHLVVFSVLIGTLGSTVPALFSVLCRPGFRSLLPLLSTLFFSRIASVSYELLESNAASLKGDCGNCEGGGATPRQFPFLAIYSTLLPLLRFSTPTPHAPPPLPLPGSECFAPLPPPSHTAAARFLSPLFGFTSILLPSRRFLTLFLTVPSVPPKLRKTCF